MLFSDMQTDEQIKILNSLIAKGIITYDEAITRAKELNLDVNLIIDFFKQ